MPRLLSLLALALLAGCTTAPPVRTELAAPARTDLPPYRAAELEPQPTEEVLWGGMIIEVRNRAEQTEIEVLAYPLDRRQRPMLKAPTEGRFIAQLPGYVERYDYPEGRFVTLRGHLRGRREALIDEKLYVYPVVEASDVHLWKRGFQDTGPRFSFGFGIGVIR
jgi:outer membrane lipoprotein